MKRVILWGGADCPKFFGFDEFNNETGAKREVEIPISKEELDLFRKNRSEEKLWKKKLKNRVEY